MTFQNAKEIEIFTLAGKAIITLTSQKTGTHFTYQIKQVKDQNTGNLKQAWFVSVLNGPDNHSDYCYIGMLDARGPMIGELAFRITRGSRAGADSPSVKGFVYFWEHIRQGHMPSQMDIQHEGHCGRCGRLLTHPESINNGIGPECIKKVGGLEATVPHSHRVKPGMRSETVFDIEAWRNKLRQPIGSRG
jgi:hypothetical protein